MSPVFTCPPLVIARNQARVQNLVESTKLERITIDSKKACRIEKKGKEEKKKPKKEQKETKREKSHKHSSRKADKHYEEQFLSSKEVIDESDQLEKSGLTEELEEPQNQLGYLSDGSQNSKKRKREDSPPAVESLIKAAPVAGNPLRIRIIFKTPKAVAQEDLVCSTSAAKSLNHHDVITSSISGSKVSEPEENQPSTPLVTIVETKKIKKHRPSKEDRYNALFDDWTRSPICFDDSFFKEDDEEWLFGEKRLEMIKPKAAVKIDGDMKMRSGDSSWPRAQFLSEVGIHSLPYTVPF